MADLAYKTSLLVKESAELYDLGTVKSVTFDVPTIDGLRIGDPARTTRS